MIGDELYPNHRKHLILLNQFGYRYDALLPHVRANFERILMLTLRAQRYSHVDQVLSTYLKPYLGLRRFIKPGARLVLFGIRSPVQKHIIRWGNRFGNPVDVYAESLAVDRYFVPRPPSGPIQRMARRLLPRAFDFQHDYDTFYVLNPDVYRDSPLRHKLGRMFDLYGSPSFRRYAELLTRDVDISQATGYDTVFLGQPLSNYETFLTPSEEEYILQEIVGNRRVLILPHPNETLNPGRDKYRVLPHARVFPGGGVPSELLLLALRPSITLTYYSTAAINYAIMNKESRNFLYRIHQSRYEMLMRYKLSLSNIVVSDKVHQQERPVRL